jgi:hypothetical protein
MTIVPIDPRIPPSPEAAEAAESLKKGYEAQQNDPLDKFFELVPREVYLQFVHPDGAFSGRDLLNVIEEVHTMALEHRANAVKWPGLWKTWESQLDKSQELATQMQFEAINAHKKAAETIAKLKADEFRLCERSAELDAREAALAQRENDIACLGKDIEQCIADADVQRKAWSDAMKKEATKLLVNDQAAWDKLSSEPIVPDSQSPAGATQIAIDKLKTRFTLEMRREIGTKLDNKLAAGVSRINSLQQASKEALAKSQKALASKLDDVQSSVIAKKNIDLGYNRAFEEFVKNYNEPNREAELKTMAAAAQAVKQSMLKADIRKEFELKYKEGIAKAEKKGMATGTIRGEITGTFSVVSKMALHSTNEPPRLLDDGARNADHVATIGYETGLRLCKFQDLCALAAPDGIAPGADFGFFDAVEDGLGEGLSRL